MLPEEMQEFDPAGIIILVRTKRNLICCGMQEKNMLHSREVMDIFSCYLCNQLKSEEELNLLRTGDYVCHECIDKRENRLREIKAQIGELEAKRTLTGILSALRVIVLIIATVTCYYLISRFHITGMVVSIAVLSLLLTINNYASQTSFPRNKNGFRSTDEITDDLTVEKDRIEGEVDSIYAKYWDFPPDWRNRRRIVRQRTAGRCERCGLNSYDSDLSFQVHHIVPRSEKEGDHSYYNLEYYAKYVIQKNPVMANL